MTNYVFLKINNNYNKYIREMYEIFIHVSSITILEICFFFYYIGHFRN